MSCQLWIAACCGWIVGMFQGRVIGLLVLTYHRRKGGVTVLRSKATQLRTWISERILGLAVIVVVLSNGLGWLVILDQNSDNDRQDRAIADVAVCTGKYLAKDASARDARSEAVKPRDDAEADFIRAVASLRDSDGSDSEGDAKKVAAIFRATDAFEKATAELNKVRSVDYPTYTCAKDH